MPALSLSAGNGNDRINIVSTGATNDIGQLTICENNIDKAVPSAMRNIRTLAMLMRLASADSALSITETLESEGISQEAGKPDIDLSHEIEEPVVAGVNDDRGLRSDSNIQAFVVSRELKLD